jgi:SAM-dependent methyltransferase
MTQSPTPPLGASPIHETVREHYAERIKNSPSYYGDSCCSLESSLYPVDLLTAVPGDIASTSYGCGDPITLASLKPGQTVLDLGSGAGLDCLLAAQKVGPEGRVIGVDMTPEMIERAQANAKRVNATNVEFRQGYLEDLPVESDTVDVIISNCVINLSPDKEKVFNEAFRALAPGGKLAVSDIVTDGELPEAVRKSLSAWAGCVAGAVEAKDYIGMMESVGFTDISIKPVFFDKETVDSALDEMKLDVKEYPREAVYKAVYSVKITAYKPA